MIVFYQLGNSSLRLLHVAENSFRLSLTRLGDVHEANHVRLVLTELLVFSRQREFGVLDLLPEVLNLAVGLLNFEKFILDLNVVGSQPVAKSFVSSLPLSNCFASDLPINFVFDVHDVHDSLLRLQDYLGYLLVLHRQVLAQLSREIGPQLVQLVLQILSDPRLSAAEVLLSLDLHESAPFENALLEFPKIISVLFELLPHLIELGSGRSLGVCCLDNCHLKLLHDVAGFIVQTEDFPLDDLDGLDKRQGDVLPLARLNLVQRLASALEIQVQFDRLLGFGVGDLSYLPAEAVGLDCLSLLHHLVE